MATNGLPSQTVCQNENIDDITFELLGAATGVVSQSSMNLPPGINANVVNFFQESEITLTDVTTITTLTDILLQLMDLIMIIEFKVVMILMILVTNFQTVFQQL